MNQPKKKPLAAAVAPTPKTPYTAARRGNDQTVNGADAFGEALDRRMTEGFNLVHGRLDAIQADVRENRHDIKGLRQELWDGLKEAAADRAQLAGKTELDRLRAELHQGFDRLEDRLEESQRQLRAEMDARFAALEESQNQLRAEMNARFAALEESNRRIIAIVSRIQEASEGAAWVRRNIWVAVAAGTSLLAIGALLRPALERAVAALLGG